MIVLLPSSDGAVKLTVAAALPGTAVTPVGVPGVLAGVTELDGTDSLESPMPLVACTVNE